MSQENKSITLQAAKFIYKQLVEKHRNKEDTSDIDILQLIEDQQLWMVDEWTHVGFCILTCLDNQKLVGLYNKGNIKVFESLVGKTIKSSNMTVDPDLIRELMVLVIENHFKSVT